MKPIIIDKRYTIRFSYAGINQYADFHEKDGELINPRLSVQYMKTDNMPDVSGMKKIEQVLAAIKSFSYCKQAEIYLINGSLAFYKKGTAELISKAYDDFIENQVSTFFKKELEPIMINKGWKIGTSHIGMMVLIVKNEEGEWDNVDGNDSFEFEYLCAKCLMALNLIKKINLTSESRNYISESPNLFCNLNNEILTSDIYIKL